MPQVRRGFCYAHTYADFGTHGYGTDSSLDAKRAAKALGARWLSLTPFAFVPGRSSDQVLLIRDAMQQKRGRSYFEANRARAETDDVVRKEIQQAQAQGFKIQLKPHLWMLDGSWRGQIDPGSAEAWSRFWTAYERFILHYADIAAEMNVQMLVVGVELDQTVDTHADRWRGLIREVRRRYRGQLVYAANWDAYHRVPFWDQLDFIGVQFYPPLADAPGADLATMQRRLDAALDALGRAAQRFGRPVLLTEVGYRAVRGTAVNPHQWPDPNARHVDDRAQARAYRVLFRGLHDRPFVEGVFLWKWYTDEVGDEGPAGFSPRGKPAAELIKQAFALP